MSSSGPTTGRVSVERAPLDADRGSEYCAVFHRAIELIGRRWNGVIVRALLAERLRELEREGVVTRSLPSSAGGSCYSLTAKGRALAPVLDAVSSWAAAWVATGGAESGDGEAAGSRRKVDRGSGQATDEELTRGSRKPLEDPT